MVWTVPESFVPAGMQEFFDVFQKHALSRLPVGQKLIDAKLCHIKGQQREVSAHLPVAETGRSEDGFH